MPLSTEPANRNSVPSACDPVTLEIVRGAIRAAQAEMEALIERTAISAFIREKKDFYTALFDADGVMAVGSNMPVFGDICRPGVPRLPARDDAAGRPLLVQRLLRLARRGLAFERPGAARAGLPRRPALRLRDGLGAFRRHRRPAAGSISPDTTDIFQEGIIIPPTKLIDAGAHQRGGAGDLLPQLALPRAEPRRHAGADGERRARREAGRGDRRALRRRRRGGCAGASCWRARGALVRAQARRDLRLRHAPLHRRDRLGRPRQRPVPHLRLR